MLFSITVAQLLFPDADSANDAGIVPLPESAPSLIPNSPFQNSITSDVDAPSYNFDNMVPVNLNLAASIPAMSTDQFTPEITSLDPQQQSIGVETAAIGAGAPTDAENPQPQCNSDSPKPGRKMRRDGDFCALAPFVPSLPNIDGFLDWVSHLIPGDVQRNAPKGALTEERKKAIVEEDEKYKPSVDHNNLVWQTPVPDPCMLGNPLGHPYRPWSLCCLGLPRIRAVAPVQPLQRRDITARVIDMENCKLYDVNRPFCSLPGPAYQLCCHNFNYQTRNEFGWLGEDCLPMWGAWGPEGLRLRINN